MALPYIPTAKINPLKTAEQNLTSLINEANGSFFKVEQLTFGMPVAPDPEDSQYTQIEVRLLRPGRPSIPMTFEYNRLDVDEMAGRAVQRRLNLDPNKSTSASVLVAARLAMRLPLDHIELSQPYETGGIVVNVKAVENSLLCYGQTAFSIAEDITQSIAVRALHGYRKPIGFIAGQAVPQWNLDAFQASA